MWAVLALVLIATSLLFLILRKKQHLKNGLVMKNITTYDNDTTM